MVEESSHPLRFFWRANCNTDQHHWASFSTKQQECYIFASDIQKKHMDINGKMWQKIFNEGWGTEKMGKKHTYVTDIYQMHGSFQALGIKRPQSLNLSNRHTHVRNQRKRKAKSSLKKKKKGRILPHLLLQGWHLFKDLTFPETSTLARVWQLHCQGSAVCMQ